MADISPSSPNLTLAECEARNVPHWHRGLEYLRPHLSECESQGMGIAWRETLPAALEEAQRVQKPIFLQYSCFEHGRMGAPNL